MLNTIGDRCNVDGATCDSLVLLIESSSDRHAILAVSDCIARGLESHIVDKIVWQVATRDTASKGLEGGLFKVSSTGRPEPPRVDFARSDLDPLFPCVEVRDDKPKVEVSATRAVII